MNLASGFAAVPVPDADLEEWAAGGVVESFVSVLSRGWLIDHPELGTCQVSLVWGAFDQTEGGVVLRGAMAAGATLPSDPMAIQVQIQDGEVLLDEGAECWVRYENLDAEGVASLCDSVASEYTR